MLYDTRRKLLPRAMVPLWLLCGLSGCAVLHDLGSRPPEPSSVIPHHSYMPRRTEVCYAAPGCYGYHPTCWTPWPEECEGCPPPAAIMEGTAPDTLSPPEPGSPTLAPKAAAWQRAQPVDPSLSSVRPLATPQDDPPEEGLQTVLPLQHEPTFTGEEEPGLLSTPAGGDNALREEKTPSGQGGMELAPTTSERAPSSPQDQPTVSRSEGDAEEVSVASWLASVTEDPAETDESDWILCVDEDPEEPAQGSANQGASQLGHPPDRIGPPSTPDPPPTTPRPVETPRVSLAYPKSVFRLFPR